MEFLRPEAKQAAEKHGFWRGIRCSIGRGDDVSRGIAAYGDVDALMSGGSVQPVGRLRHCNGGQIPNKTSRRLRETYLRYSQKGSRQDAKSHNVQIFNSPFMIPSQFSPMIPPFGEKCSLLSTFRQVAAPGAAASLPITSAWRLIHRAVCGRPSLQAAKTLVEETSITPPDLLLADPGQRLRRRHGW